MAWLNLSSPSAKPGKSTLPSSLEKCVTVSPSIRRLTPHSPGRCLRQDSVPGKGSETAAACKSTSTMGPASTAAAAPATRWSKKMRYAWYSSWVKDKGKGGDEAEGNARTATPMARMPAVTVARTHISTKLSNPTPQAAETAPRTRFRLLLRPAPSQNEETRAKKTRKVFHATLPTEEIPKSRRRWAAVYLTGHRLHHSCRPLLLPIERIKPLLLRLPIPALLLMSLLLLSPARGRATGCFVLGGHGPRSEREPHSTSRPSGESWPSLTGDKKKTTLTRVSYMFCVFHFVKSLTLMTVNASLTV